MKIFPKIIHSTLLVTTSTLVAYPTGEHPRIAPQYENRTPFQIPDLRTLSYDEVVEMLSKIESDSFEDNCSMDELDQINQFISFLALEGATDDEKIDMANATASLFRKDDIHYALFGSSEFGLAARPTIYFEGSQDIVLCKSWCKKQWKQTRAFVKKHKKAIIIGAIIVVTVAVVVVAAVVISSSAAGTAAAAGLASAGGAAGTPGSKDDPKSYYEPSQTSSNESLASSLQEQASSFKETTAKEQFAAVSESNGVSIEENGRIIGSLFAHKAVETLTTSVAENPFLAAELKDLGFNSEYPIPKWEQTYSENPTLASHYSTDSAFSTDYTTSYGETYGDLNAMTYQERGNLALNSEYYTQALQDFDQAISLNPDNPTLYVERGVANFELGNYEDSMADYSQYIEKKGEPFSVTEFGVGYVKGITKGVYESGKGALVFLSDFIEHPVQSSKEMVDSLSQLAVLVKNDEFGTIAKALTPELYQLVTEWDTLSSETRGELAGYTIGKLGTDIIAPGAAAKVASKSVSSAKELVAICKNVQIAQEVFVLETAAGIGNTAKIAEVVEVGKKTAALGEELGYTAREIGQLQKTGQLEARIADAAERLSPPMKESFECFDKAQKFLKPYKSFMSESQARELIHQTGVKTFPKPQGIPDNFRVKISDRGAGMKYIHPTDEGTYVRVMPGKPHSPNSYQQKPYVTYQKNGNTIDKYGNIVDKEALEAHIPYEEFLYKE